MGEALCRYNMQFGLPTSLQKDILFAAARDILAVDTWKGFYSRLGLPVPSTQQQASILRQSIQDSSYNGYHTISSQANRGRQQKLTKASQPGQRRARPMIATEKVGVKQDLKNAFTKADKKHQRKAPAIQESNAGATVAPRSNRTAP